MTSASASTVTVTLVLAVIAVTPTKLGPPTELQTTTSFVPGELLSQTAQVSDGAQMPRPMPVSVTDTTEKASRFCQEAWRVACLPMPPHQEFFSP